MMTRLDDIIKEKEYDLQLLKLLKEVIESGDCNICKIKEKCEYAPEIGELVRYNCPLFVPKKKDKNTDQNLPSEYYVGQDIISSNQMLEGAKAYKATSDIIKGKRKNE